MSDQERLEDAVLEAGIKAALVAIDAGEGEEFLRSCGWTQLEIDEALGRP